MISVLTHHLRIFGWPDDGLDQGIDPRLQVLYRPTAPLTQMQYAFMANGGTIVAVQPSEHFCGPFGIQREAVIDAPANLTCAQGPAIVRRLRTLHRAYSYGSDDGEPIVTGENGERTWLWRAFDKGGLIVIGTDLPNDLIRYRQGDRQAVSKRVQQITPIGLAVEKPQYLFEAQLAGEEWSARHADQWMTALISILSKRMGIKSAPILPGGAPGAIVVTGDDDMAALAHYSIQLDLLDGIPVTYFLHPRSNHTPQTIETMLMPRGVDLGLHPDALENPQCYARLLDDQVAWFRALTGQVPRIVRNHGFLNDGYWGHLPAWRSNGITMSANIPSHDGRVLNGSLLPARVYEGGTLTEHWSILTAITDGARFQLRMTDAEAAVRIFQLADAVRSSGMPGVIVLNLHPENANACKAMHEAARELAASNFIAWTMRQCWNWFNHSDRPLL